MADRPTGRKKVTESGGTGVHRRGEGLGTGPVGSGSNFHGGSGSSGSSAGRPAPSRAGTRGGGISLGAIVLIAIVFFLFRGMGDSGSDSDYETESAQTEQQAGQVTQTQESSGAGDLLAALFGGGDSWSGASSAIGDWKDTSYEQGKLDTGVAPNARAKRTTIRGDGTDQNVILVYLCGTDLESKSGMASGDLQEMAAAPLNRNVRIYVYTGGCKKWNINGISTRVNQIYEVADGGIRLLEADMGSGSMVDPATLIQFLKWAKTHTSGNRYDLIFWDHGGGSISGFGYDEKDPRAGSMDLADIGRALKEGQLTYDFVGFDACLMATVETALVVGDYADYLIASEEVEPGIGWHYTPWLTALAKDPGLPTVEIGKSIADSFTDACGQLAGGQKTTLSVTDLAELSLTVPDSLKEFATSASRLIEEKNYQTVSDARSGTREFAPSCKIDQVDLAHLAMNLGTEEGQALADAILGAVKYNRTSPSMTNSYGLSVYFPKRKSSAVDSMVDTYEQIGMDSDYTKVIEQAAAMNTYGQAGSGSQESAYDSLFETGGDSSTGAQTIEVISDLLGTLLSSDYARSAGLTSSNTGFLARSGITPEFAAEQVAAHRFPSEQLLWQENADGDTVISMDRDGWAQTKDLVLNLFYDDGEGYVDLGLDNVYDFDDDGNLLAPTDRTWLSVNGQPVAYYYIDETDQPDGSTITGRIPALLNGERVDLLVVFDAAHPEGRITGANTDYLSAGQEVAVVAKNLTEIAAGDTIDFLCDFYSYEGEYQDSYLLGETLTVPEGGMEALRIRNTDVGTGEVRMLYRFTDSYGGTYWTPPVTF